MRGKILTLHPPHLSEDAATASDIYRHLLGKYQLGNIDSAMRWLELGCYLDISKSGIAGITLLSWYVMTDKGREATDQGRFSDDERKLLHQEEDPYAVFVAYQFNQDDTDIVTYIRDKVLTPNGFKLIDGRAEGLEEFRTSVVVFCHFWRLRDTLRPYPIHSWAQGHMSHAASHGGSCSCGDRPRGYLA